MAPIVSVIVPAHNSSRTIAETIKSVLNQTFRNIEVIIVDDGSTDDTVRVINQFKDRRLNYIYQKHQERSAARNNGIAHAKGKFMAFLDADDLWLPEKLHKQLELFEKYPDIGLAYSDLFGFDDKTEKDQYLFSNRRKLWRGNIWLNLLFEDNFIQSPTPVLRREVFDKVGLFDTALTTVEDWDMWLRVAYRYPVDYVDEPLARYRVHKNWTSWSNPSRIFYESTVKLYDKVEFHWASDDLALKKKVGNLRGLADYRYGLALLRRRRFVESLIYLGAGLKSNPTYPMIYVLRQLKFDNFTGSKQTSN